MEEIRPIDFDMDQWLLDMGVAVGWVPYLATFILLVILLLVSIIAYYITKRLVVVQLSRLLERTQNEWDDLLIRQKFFRRLAKIVPALIVIYFAPLVFADFPGLIPVVAIITNVYVIVIVLMVLVSLLNTLSEVFKQHPSFRDKPIDSYFQLAKIIIYLLSFVLILSVVLQKSPLVFVSAFGALTAVILLIFKDTLLGTVASVQIAANDLVRVGDWVSLPKYEADGDVLAIYLTTVKIQNWDKTISTIPTYAFIADSFKNMRGMQEAGGRRIKRPLNINLNSVKFCTPEMLERYRKMRLVRGYIESRQEEIARWNKERNTEDGPLINGRNLTNIGVFRQYVLAYLQSLPTIRQDMSLMVRQMEPTSEGLPLQIYCFTNTVVWAEYEGIQSDIFDHLISAVPAFDLELYQSPTGKDVVTAGQMMGQTINRSEE